jgi:hypothetical protein
MVNEGKDTIWINIKFPIRYTLLIAFVNIVLDVCYFFITKTWDDTLIFTAATGAATGGILAAFYTGRILSYYLRLEKFYKDQQNLAIDFQKKAITMDFAKRWNEPTMKRTRKICREVIDLRSRSAEEAKSIINQENKIDIVIHLLNFFEEIAVAVEYETGNEKMLKEMFKEVVIRTWAGLFLWLTEYRQERNAPMAWEKVETLNGRWM